jgi:hypothetical protein
VADADLDACTIGNTVDSGRSDNKHVKKSLSI